MRNLYKSILIVVVAVFSLESVATAQILKNLLKQTTTAATASTPTAYSQGQTAGVALKSLYAQYKTDGKKLDMGNLSNILSVASLAGSVGELKTADASYKKEYAKGLVLGSLNLVTEPQSTSVISGLTDGESSSEHALITPANAKAKHTYRTFAHLTINPFFILMLIV